MILRRLGPNTDSALCVGGHNCPNIFELTTGDFAVVGTDITASESGFLPPEAGCGPQERIVRVPRQTLIQARHDIPASL